MIKSRARDRKSHAPQFRDHIVCPFKGLRPQTSAELSRLKNDRMRTKLHQLIACDDASSARAYDRDFGTHRVFWQTSQASGMFNPVVISEGEIRAKNGQRFHAWSLSRDRRVGRADACSFDVL